MADPCPCCGNLTIARRDRHEVCPVCWWEDDPAQAADPQLVSESNAVSLEEARRNYREIGAAEPVLVGMARAPTEEEKAPPPEPQRSEVRPVVADSSATGARPRRLAMGPELAAQVPPWCRAREFVALSRAQRDVTITAISEPLAEGLAQAQRAGQRPADLAVADWEATLGLTGVATPLDPPGELPPLDGRKGAWRLLEHREPSGAAVRHLIAAWTDGVDRWIAHARFPGGGGYDAAAIKQVRRCRLVERPGRGPGMAQRRLHPIAIKDFWVERHLLVLSPLGRTVLSVTASPARRDLIPDTTHTPAGTAQAFGGRPSRWRRYATNGPYGPTTVTEVWSEAPDCIWFARGEHIATDRVDVDTLLASVTSTDA